MERKATAQGAPAQWCRAAFQVAMGASARPAGPVLSSHGTEASRGRLEKRGATKRWKQGGISLRKMKKNPNQLKYTDHVELKLRSVKSTLGEGEVLPDTRPPEELDAEETSGRKP